MGNKPRGDRELTPFAEALQDWLYHGHRIPWSRATLAKELKIPHSTVTGWFVRGNMPEADAFHALLRVTEWEPEKLMRLTGYTEMPARTENIWQFVHRKLRETSFFDVSRIVEAEHLLDDWQKEYEALPTRPPRRRARSTAAAEATSSAETTEAPTRAAPAARSQTPSSTRRERAHVGR